jgi:hypothetical protein
MFGFLILDTFHPISRGRNVKVTAYFEKSDRHL